GTCEQAGAGRTAGWWHPRPRAARRAPRRPRRSAARCRRDRRAASTLDLRDRRLGAAVGADLDGQRLLLDPVRVAEEIRLFGGERDDDPVGQLEARILAHRVDLVDHVEHLALETQLVVERRVETDRDTVVLGDRPALAAAALDEDLVGRELVSADTDVPVGELRAVA